MNQCKDCDYWKQELFGGLQVNLPITIDFGFCEGINPVEIQDRLGYSLKEISSIEEKDLISKMIINVSEWFQAIQTHKDFGCVLWKAKTKRVAVEI